MALSRLVRCRDVCKLRWLFILFNCVTRDVTRHLIGSSGLNHSNPPSFDEAAEEIRHLLLQSVQRRLMSDVPLGVFVWRCRFKLCSCCH